MHRLLVLMVVAVGLLAPAAAAAAQTEDGETGLGIRLAEAPSDRADDPRAQRYIIDHVPPGDRIERRVELSNDTLMPLTVAVYGGDAVITDGKFTPAPEEAPVELRVWTAVDRPSVELQPGEQQQVAVTIAVPDDATPGERYGAIWAEIADEDGPITLVNRVGVRIYLSVGEGGEPASDFEIESLTASRTDDGAPVVQALVRNTGGRALDMIGELSLSDGPGALSAGPFPAELGSTLGIGDSEPVEVPLSPELPDGPWKATITLRSGTLERSAEATITFPDRAGASASAVSASSTTDSGDDLLALTIAGSLALVVLASLLWYLLERRRRRRRRDEEAAAAA